MGCRWQSARLVAHGTTTLVVWLVVAQFGVQGVSSLPANLRRISPSNCCRSAQPTHVQLMVMEKANTLDLAFFEDAKFYDPLAAGAARGGDRGPLA